MGIKIIFCGFGDLVPVNEMIYKQRFDTWRIAWEKERDLTLASQELEAMSHVTRREFSQQTLASLVTLSLLETLFQRDAFGEDVKPLAAKRTVGHAESPDASRHG